jgi:Fe-S-cluster containining protein
MSEGDDRDDTPECLACGTCCFSTLDRYVPVSGDDYARLGDAAETLVTWIGHRAYLRMEDGHCAALAIDASAGRFVCTVYEARPATCRELARGSPECAGERATKGERPLIALRRSRNG